MDYRVDDSWIGHPKTRQLYASHGGDGLVALQSVWRYTTLHRPRGVLHGITREVLVLILEPQGRFGPEFIDDLTSIGWLDLHDDGTYEVHDWEDWNPWAAHSEERSERAAAAAAARWGGKKVPNTAKNKKKSENAERIAKNKKGNAPSPSPFPNKKTFHPDSDEVRMAKVLFELIRKRNPDHKEPDIQAWAKHVDLIMRMDGKKVEEIERVIRWCQADKFWGTVILSTESLRKKFDQLVLKMQSGDDKEKGQGQVGLEQDDAAKQTEKIIEAGRRAMEKATPPPEWVRTRAYSDPKPEALQAGDDHPP